VIDIGKLIKLDNSYAEVVLFTESTQTYYSTRKFVFLTLMSTTLKDS